MSTAQATGGPLLEVRGLVKHYPVLEGVLRRRSGAVRAVDGVDLDLDEGETLGLVGESGSGKSTLGRAILQLDRPTAGSVRFRGRELTELRGGALRAMRRSMQMIFQDPYASLNPRIPVGRMIREPLDIHALGTPAERERRVLELLERVGLEAGAAARYPHEFSGGQRQRVGIARALATSPALVVADEPIAALDVSIQAQIVNLMADLRAELGLTYLFIAHDLSMVRHISDRVAVMYLGRIVELGACDEVFHRPRHPYTRALVAAIPSTDSRRTEPVPVLEGDVPSPAAPPPGCPFHPRCPIAEPPCATARPELADLGAGDPHRVACHLADAPASSPVADP